MASYNQMQKKEMYSSLYWAVLRVLTSFGREERWEKCDFANYTKDRETTSGKVYALHIFARTNAKIAAIKKTYTKCFQMPKRATDADELTKREELKFHDLTETG